MDLSYFADADGVLLRRDVIAAGLEDKVITRAVRRREIVRVRQGAYVLAPLWELADESRRHALLTIAVRRLYDDTVALSHVSACLAYGAPMWRQDLSRVHLTDLFGRGDRTAARVVHHRGNCRLGDVRRDRFGWITTPSRSALDAASLLPFVAAVVLVDHFLHEGLTSRQELEEQITSKQRWPDTLALIRVVGATDPASESPGESRFRLLCRDVGLPRPVSQYVVRDQNGREAGRVDFAWPEFGILVEFDGMEKYHRYRRPGESIEECVVREKRREDLLRELTGWVVLRFTWADLEHPDKVAARIHRAISRHR